MEIADYIRDPRILPNGKHEFRNKLHLEHISRGGGDIIEVDFGDWKEKILVFQGKMLEIPRLRYFPRGINSVKDGYLRELVAFYMHINPHIDSVGIKRMTEYIVRAMVQKSGDVPILKFEDLEGVVKQLAEVYRNKSLPKHRFVLVLYSKDTKMSVEDRRQYSYFANRMKQKKFKQDSIHLAAQAALDLNENYLLITNPRVWTHIHDKDEIPSARSLGDNMSDLTKDMLSDQNEGRFFKTDKSFKKFTKFLALPSGTSLDDATKQLNASKSTVVEYNRIRKELNL